MSLIAQQYRKRMNFVTKAIETEITDGRWNEFVSSGVPTARERAEKEIRMKETAVIMKQKVILPTVSRRALPEGKRRGSTWETARLVTMRVTFERGSKMASAIVVKRDSDPDDI